MCNEWLACRVFLENSEREKVFGIERGKFEGVCFRGGEEWIR